jgi:hypothetical protein
MAARNLDDRLRGQTKGPDSRSEGKERGLKSRIEWYVEEGSFRFSRLAGSGHSVSVRPGLFEKRPLLSCGGASGCSCFRGLQLRFFVPIFSL